MGGQLLKPKKMKVTEKCWKIDFTNVDEAYMYNQDQFFCYTETRGKAKSILLNKHKYDLVLYSGEELNYLNIPVVRDKEFDKYDYFGQSLSLGEIKELKQKEEREKELDDIAKDENITHCYIRKGGYYYKPNNCGYTEYITFAGVYTKKDAIRSCRGCSELRAIPIDIEEHNQRVNDQIDNLRLRLI